MTDLMRCMYQHYIKPDIERQPKSLDEAMVFDLLHNELDPHMQQTLQHALAFYAVQGFRLGVRTGITLQAELT